MHIFVQHELKEEEPIPTDEITNASYDYSSRANDHTKELIDYSENPVEYPDGTKQNVLDSEVGHIEISEIKIADSQTARTIGSVEIEDPAPILSASMVPPKPLHAVIASQGTQSDDTRRQLVPNRYLTTINGPISRMPPSIDRSDIPPLRRKPAIGGTRPSLPFIHRNRPGGRPTFIPPRRPPFNSSSSSLSSLSSSSSPSSPRQISTTTESVTEVSHIVIPRFSTTKLTTVPTSTIPTSTIPTSTIPTTTTAAAASTNSPVPSDFASFLEKVGGIGSKPEFLLPRPIQQTTSLESGEIENLLLQNKFQYAETQRTSTKPKKTPPKPILPEIPEEIKSQLPLGIDAILASGAFQLSGCNIYGREYVVGDNIKELSAPCKACRCTPVGVQCLPIC
ncbi:hypothetical protein FHG87_019963 [Trinorchestia longiramus]|nr:hypothetical protein FHG87_019963 [Trinorchestia longiramus]